MEARMRGLWFEELEVGAAYETGGRTVTDAEIVAFAGVSGDFNPLHMDEEYARGTAFGGRVAHGVLGLALATGLLNRSGLTEGTLVALLGLEWSFRAPIRPGDTVRARVKVAAKRATRKAEQGYVAFGLEVVNQRGEVAQEGELKALVRRRGSG